MMLRSSFFPPFLFLPEKAKSQPPRCSDGTVDSSVRCDFRKRKITLESSVSAASWIISLRFWVTDSLFERDQIDGSARQHSEGICSVFYAKSTT